MAQTGGSVRDRGGLVELPVGSGLWRAVFSVAPLVLVGTKEGDGYDFAPKHMAMPLGWEGFYCFVCSPRHATYTERGRASAVHGQLPPAGADRRVEPRRGRPAGRTARSRRWRPFRPCRRGWSTCRVVEGCSLVPRVRARADRRRVRAEQPDRRARGGRCRQPGRAARRGGATTPISSTGSACSPISRPGGSRSCATAGRSRIRSTFGCSAMAARDRTAVAALAQRAPAGDGLQLLERLVRAESPSLDPATQQGPFRILAAELERIDYLVRPVRDGAASATTCTRGRGTRRAASRGSS